MRKFLKIYFKFNIFLNLVLIIYAALAFIASAVGLDFVMHYINLIQDFATFGMAEWITHPIYVSGASLFAFFINQYFHKVSITLYNFDKFREISGLFVIPIFASFQLIINSFLLGIFALIPFVANALAGILLMILQKNNRKNYIQQTLNTNDTLFDPTMQEMSLKIGQLRILKSEGKISEEEFMFHLNNILEDKE
ncbi:MAG: hypothetical protein E7361_00125 [Clostridiales bacterium]|nr:hypothetical protein [Clostridiales bacterium]